MRVHRLQPGEVDQVRARLEPIGTGAGAASLQVEAAPPRGVRDPGGAEIPRAPGSRPPMTPRL